MVLVGLGVFVVSPHSASAQSCTSTPAIAGDLPKLILDDTTPYTDGISCSGLTGGLELTLGGAQVGTSQRAVDDAGISIDGIDGEGAGDKDIVATGNVTIHSEGWGISMERKGTGKLQLQLGPESRIVPKGEDGNLGIYLQHMGQADQKTGGIDLVSRAKIDVTGGGENEDVGGIEVSTEDAPATTTIPIDITLQSGTITIDKPGTEFSGDGVFVDHYARGDIMITVEKDMHVGTEEAPIGSDGIYVTLNSQSQSDITVRHWGKIYAKVGIKVRNFATSAEQGSISITTEKDSGIVAKGSKGSAHKPMGIWAEIGESASTSAGDIKVIHNGSLDVEGEIGIWALNSGTGSVRVETGAKSTISVTGDGAHSGINASTRYSGGGDVTIVHRGVITADGRGIYARTETGSSSVIRITTTVGSRITAKEEGLRIWPKGTGPSYVTIRDVVRGGGSHAGIYFLVKTTDTRAGGGGEIVLGPWGHVSSDSDTAIRVDSGAGEIKVILEKDEAGVVGHLEGKILNPAATGENTGNTDTRSPLKFLTRTKSGTQEDLEAEDHVYRRGKRTGVYEQVIKTQLTKLAGTEKGYRFVDDDPPGDLRLYSHRARLYEVLPSMLLGLVDLTPYSTRMAVPRRSASEGEVMVESSKGEHVAAPDSGPGVWVRLAVRDGERMADTSTTATDFWRQPLSWDVKQTGFEAGLEVPTDDHLVLGVSAHYRQSEATVRNGGTMEASGTGMGLSLTWTDDSGLYVDGQLNYTRFFDVALTSSRNGQITSKGGGSGLAFGVEVGQPMSIGGMAVTPRGGLSWSSVDMDAFDEPTTIDGAGRVTPDKEQSVQGRVGVLAELGSGEADRRLYASLDLEHEFSSRHEAMVAGTRLETEMKPTWVRLGVGGAMPLSDRDTTLLTGDAFYATAGSDNTDFGGGLSVTFRF